MAPPLYELHGLLVRTSLPLAARKGPTEPQPGDVSIRAASEPPKAPQGAVSATLGATATLRRIRHGHLATFSGGTRVLISEDLARVEYWHAPPETPAYTASLIVGPVLAAHADLRGHLALHSSALEFDGGAIAVAGPPHAGKSSIALSLAMRGRPLVTDDVLCMTVSSSQVVCHRGTTILRIRSGSRELLEASQFGGALTHDHRQAAFPPITAKSSLDVRAIVFPHFEQRTDAKLVRVGNAAAAAVLGGTTRIRWHDPGAAAQQLGVVARIVRSTPVFRLVLPDHPELLRAVLCEPDLEGMLASV